MTEQTSAFPPPPPFFAHHTSANRAALAALPQPVTHESLPADSELRYLLPPPPPEGSYYSFGAHWLLPERHATLEDNGVQRLYSDAADAGDNAGSVDRVVELRRLSKSLLLGYLELVGILGIAPEEFPDKTNDLQTILFNTHHLINKYRPHQARETLCLLLEDQLSRINRETEQNWDAVRRVDEVIAKTEQVGRRIREERELEARSRRAGVDREAEERRRRDWEAWNAIVGAGD